jgi:hypothetical protein
LVQSYQSGALRQLIIRDNVEKIIQEQAIIEEHNLQMQNAHREQNMEMMRAMVESQSRAVPTIMNELTELSSSSHQQPTRILIDKIEGNVYNKQKPEPKKEKPEPSKAKTTGFTRSSSTKEPKKIEKKKEKVTHGTTPVNFSTFDEWYKNDDGKKRQKGFLVDQLELRNIRLSKTDKKTKTNKELINMLSQHPV